MSTEIKMNRDGHWMLPIKMITKTNPASEMGHIVLIANIIIITLSTRVQDLALFSQNLIKF
jgi:hypothetical protein